MFDAETFEDLLDKLTGINVVVPKRGKPRPTSYRELYSVVRLLGSLPRLIDDFPLALQKHERPDFLLTCRNLTIGIEVTEAVSQNNAKAATLLVEATGKSTTPIVSYESPAFISDTIKSRKELLEDMENGDIGQWWNGDSVERSWAEAMIHCIKGKLGKARSHDYGLYDENWLLIYDNWTAPLLALEIALTDLQAGIKPTNPWSTFSRIFILRYKVLVELFPETVLFHSVNHCESPQPMHRESHIELVGSDTCENEGAVDASNHDHVPLTPL